MNVVCVITDVALNLVLFNIKEFTREKNHMNVTSANILFQVELILENTKKFIQVKSRINATYLITQVVIIPILYDIKKFIYNVRVFLSLIICKKIFMGKQPYNCFFL
jgi:hypothetical protein